MAAKSTMSLIIAVVAHKWAEAFTLGISFAKSNTEKSRFVKLILLFSIFTPAGIASGIIVSGFPGWVEAMFFSLSVGTFFYVAITEIIIEEFSVSKHKVLKFLLFLLGSFMIAGLTVWEHAGGGHHHH